MATDLTRTGFIYFIASASQQAVKIGFAEDVSERHGSLQTGNPCELEVLARIRATIGAEQALHKLLKKHCLHLEWYPDSDLIYFLMVELQDEALDRGLDWLAEHDPFAQDPEDISQAIGESPITATDMAEIIEGYMSECAENTGIKV